MRNAVLAWAVIAAFGIGGAKAETPAAGIPAGANAASVPLGAAAAAPAADTVTDKDAAATTAPSPAEASATPPAPPPVRNLVVAHIDLATQRMTVTVEGDVRHTWPISSGRAGFPTPRGNFRAQWMSRMWYSRKYDLAPMPYSVFFHGGAAIHGTTSVGMLGRPASHGCVRLATANAAAFYGLVKRYGLASTQVIVTGTPPRSRGEDLIARGPRMTPPVRMVAPRGPYYSRYVYDGYTLRPMPWRSPYGYAGRALVYPGDAPVRYR